MNHQKTSVMTKKGGRHVKVNVYEDTEKGHLVMHVLGVRTTVEQVARAAYEQLVTEQKIVAMYKLVKVVHAKPGTGAYVHFVDIREPANVWANNPDFEVEVEA